MLNLSKVKHILGGVVVGFELVMSVPLVRASLELRPELYLCTSGVLNGRNFLGGGLRRDLTKESLMRTR